MLDEFRARPKEASAIDLDTKVVAAARADAREPLSAMASSVAEGCKSIVVARCKLTGMHWRHANAAGVALLRATLGSNFKIVA